MKKIMRGILMLALILFPVHNCLGETLPELHAEIEALGCWTQTYEAHGRTVEVDIPVIIPDVDCIPITTVSSFPPYEEHELEDSERLIEFEDKTFWGRSFENKEIQATMRIPTLFDSVQIQADSPDEKRMIANPKDFLKYEKSVYYPWEFDEYYATFAEDNAISLGEAYEFVRDTVNHLYKDNDGIDIDYIEIRDKARKTRGLDDFNLGETVDYYPSGSYYMKLCQSCNGVPVYTYAMRLFDPYKSVDNKIDSSEFARLNSLLFEGEIMSLQSYSMIITMMKKEQIIEENPPLAPVSKIISAIEKEIEAGRVRNVYSLRLGYVCYLSKDSSAPYTLYPTWICECDYTQTANEAGSFYFEGEGIREGTKFALVGVNAVTGELFDRRYPPQELIYCPE